jgi:hypothetical protein
MHDWPGMWGWCRESFALQVALLLEMGGLPREQALKLVTRASGGTTNIQMVREPWAAKLAAEALEALSEAPTPDEHVPADEASSPEG